MFHATFKVPNFTVLYTFNSLGVGGVPFVTCSALCPPKPPQVWREDGLVKPQGTLLGAGTSEAHD